MKRTETAACTMETAIGQSPVSFHISLNVSDLARSVDFYRKLFGQPPAKERPDYAKFESQNPPVTLSLVTAGGVGSGGSLNHVGFRLRDTAELVELQRRLEMAGLASQREHGVECCYSRQTKFWLHDPDQTLWEFYIVEDDVPEDAVHCGNAASGQAATTAVPLAPLPPSRAASPASSSPGPPTDWEHRLDGEFPIPLPFDDGSLTEVRLRGTFNVPVEGTTREAMFAEILRVLVPGGRVILHQLTAESPFSDGVLALPGPAAVVREVPVDREVLSWVEDGGFEQIRLVKFSGTPTFERDGVALREMIVEAKKPPGEETADRIVVVYKGPLRELLDDAGRVFRRGERVGISRAAWNALQSGPLEESFVRITEQPLVSRHAHT